MNCLKLFQNPCEIWDTTENVDIVFKKMTSKINKEAVTSIIQMSGFSIQKL